MLAENFVVSTLMLLLLLLCPLIIIVTLLGSPSITTTFTAVNTTNFTETESKRDCHTNQEQKTCETTHCNEIAKKLLQSMDATVNPCENFYKYACGSWKKHNPIPLYQQGWSEDHIIMEKTYRRIIGVLAEREKPDDIPPVKMARKLYRSCMDVVTIEKRGVKPILQILDSTGGWPIITPGKEWDSDKISWQEIDKQYLPLMHSSAFYEIGFEIDQNHTDRYVLTINQNQNVEGFLANRKALVEIYIEHLFQISHIIEAFAREKDYILNRHQVANETVKLLRFTQKLVEIIPSDKKSDTSDDNYERMTIEGLQKWYDSSDVTAPTAKINFLDAIQSMYTTVNISINASEPILVYKPKYFHKLAQLLAHTFPRLIVNYIQWNFVSKFLTYTMEEIRNENRRKLFSSHDISSSVPRWVECVSDMKMGHAISYMFVRKYISDEIINKAKKMVENLKTSLRQQIAEARWVSEADKKRLIHKVDAIESQIGYPDWYKDEQALIKYYEGLSIGADYFQNILNCKKDEFLRSLRKFREPVMRNEWSGYPVEVNAYCDQQKNVINVPAAELQDLYFTPLLLDAINYGNIGFTIGHELSHNFDNEGIQLNANGFKTPWASQEMFDKYEEKATCFVDQYSNYTVDIKSKDGQYIKLDGSLTECENIADSIGIQIAYSAFKEVTKQKIHTKLPGLENVSNEELFFLMFANSWCSSVKRKYELFLINNDNHSPPMYRVIGTLSNMAEFSQVFKCPRNSTMNPQNKCNIWN